jgi:tetratricopeptide (TPR) repeat protein
MKRTRPRQQTLKHLPFFEVLATAPEGSPDAKLATAGLLALRMIDHWVLAGPAIVEPESVSVRSVRQAIMALPPREPVREALLTIVNTMQMLRLVDLVPVLPRVFAYAQLLERHHGALALAADAYESVIRLSDTEYDAELVMDSLQALAYCQRKSGDLDAAEESFTTLVKMATRRKDRARALRGRTGIGLVAMMRGDLAAADSQFNAVALEAKRFDIVTEFVRAIHNRGVVAARAGRMIDAVKHSHQALKLATDPTDRDFVLGDLAAFLVKAELYDAAMDALRILEVTAVSEEPRESARVNQLVIAARVGDRRAFDSARAALANAQLTMEARVNLLIESARGLRRFGQVAEAEVLLAQAVSEANAHGLEGSVGEARRLEQTWQHQPAPMAESDVAARAETAEVASDLRRMALQLAVVS